ncbi:hypothetical protein HGRIS_005867 [Hohenbuehelia grisea]|uniref:Uncharacterized protein n=1 Tax=Hohenbuehelia grisea TaxID=104357 RepID=A0ABR3K0I9_9AGAR
MSGKYPHHPARDTRPLPPPPSTQTRPLPAASASAPHPRATHASSSSSPTPTKGHKWVRTERHNTRSTATASARLNTTHQLGVIAAKNDATLSSPPVSARVSRRTQHKSAKRASGTTFDDVPGVPLSKKRKRSGVLYYVSSLNFQHIQLFEDIIEIDSDSDGPSPVKAARPNQESNVIDLVSDEEQDAAVVVTPAPPSSSPVKSRLAARTRRGAAPKDFLTRRQLKSPHSSSALPSTPRTPPLILPFVPLDLPPSSPQPPEEDHFTRLSPPDTAQSSSPIDQLLSSTDDRPFSPPIVDQQFSLADSPIASHARPSSVGDPTPTDFNTDFNNTQELVASITLPDVLPKSLRTLNSTTNARVPMEGIEETVLPNPLADSPDCSLAVIETFPPAPIAPSSHASASFQPIHVPSLASRSCSIPHSSTSGAPSTHKVAGSHSGSAANLKNLQPVHTTRENLASRDQHLAQLSTVRPSTTAFPSAPSKGSSVSSQESEQSTTTSASTTVSSISDKPSKRRPSKTSPARLAGSGGKKVARRNQLGAKLKGPQANQNDLPEKANTRKSIDDIASSAQIQINAHSEELASPGRNLKHAVPAVQPNKSVLGSPDNGEGSRGEADEDTSSLPPSLSRRKAPKADDNRARNEAVLAPSSAPVYEAASQPALPRTSAVSPYSISSEPDVTAANAPQTLRSASATSPTIPVNGTRFFDRVRTVRVGEEPTFSQPTTSSSLPPPTPALRETTASRIRSMPALSDTLSYARTAALPPLDRSIVVQSPVGASPIVNAPPLRDNKGVGQPSEPLIDPKPVNTPTGVSSHPHAPVMAARDSPSPVIRATLGDVDSEHLGDAQRSLFKSTRESMIPPSDIYQVWQALLDSASDGDSDDVTAEARTVDAEDVVPRGKSNKELRYASTPELNDPQDSDVRNPEAVADVAIGLENTSIADDGAAIQVSSDRAPSPDTVQLDIQSSLEAYLAAESQGDGDTDAEMLNQGAEIMIVDEDGEPHGEGTRQTNSEGSAGTASPSAETIKKPRDLIKEEANNSAALTAVTDQKSLGSIHALRRNWVEKQKAVFLAPNPLPPAPSLTFSDASLLGSPDPEHTLINGDRPMQSSSNTNRKYPLEEESEDEDDEELSMMDLVYPGFPI